MSNEETEMLSESCYKGQHRECGIHQKSTKNSVGCDCECHEEVACYCCGGAGEYVANKVGLGMMYDNSQEHECIETCKICGGSGTLPAWFACPEKFGEFNE